MASHSTETTVLFTGPTGSSDNRVIPLFKTLDAVQPLPMDGVGRVLETVNVTPGTMGVVPIESNVAGDLVPIIDRLVFAAENVVFRDEAVLAEPIGAWAASGDAVPRTVVSHQDIHAICSQYIRVNRSVQRAVDATSVACQIVRDAADRELVALAPPRVAEQYGLVRIDEDAADFGDIRTRYLLAGRSLGKPTGDDHTFFVIKPTSERPGLLRDMLEPFQNNGVNLLRLSSRPLGSEQVFWFLVIAEGHADDPALQDAFAALQQLGVADVRVLGAYPAWQGTPVGSPYVPSGSALTPASA